MATAEQAREMQINPADLEAAMNSLLETRGQQLPTGGARVDFLTDMPKNPRPQEWPYYSLEQYHGRDGYPVYAFLSITPGAGYAEEHLAFLGDEVASQRHTKLFGRVSETPRDCGPILDDEAIKDLFLLVTDPELETLEGMTARFHRERFKQSIAGRLLTTILRRDRYPHFA